MTLPDSITAFSKHTDAQVPAPRLTIFSVVKPFVGLADVHQRNAFASWKTLGPDVEVILFSDSDIPNDVAAQAICFRTTAENRFGTPLLSEVFEMAAREGRGVVRAFVNADIILDERFVRAANRLLMLRTSRWLAVGQRTELDLPELVAHTSTEWVADCFRRMEVQGSPASIVCKDYFMFTANLFREIPGFAIGRGNWDNWMVWHAKSQGVPVVDLTRMVPVIHQKHDYPHVSGGRLSAYVHGPEARENQRLAGGRRLVTGSTPNWRLDESALRPIAFANVRLARDVFRFAELLFQMLASAWQSRRSPASGTLGESPTL